MNSWGSAIILCGGKSRRMGRDKCSMKIRGRLLVEIKAEKLKNIFNEVIIVADRLDKFSDFGCKVVEDIKKGCGPAVGIYSGLKAISSQYAYVTACDMPFINLDYIKYMGSIIEKYSPDCVISKNGRLCEPLCAFYSKNMIESFDDHIRRGSYKISDIFNECNTFYVEDKVVSSFSKDKEIFINLNYIEDLNAFKKLYNKEASIDGKCK